MRVGVTVTSNMPRSGDNPVAFSVAPNDNTSARTGTIVVRDQVVTITQAGSQRTAGSRRCFQARSAPDDRWQSIRQHT